MPQVIMPKMGDAMDEGVLLRWLKNEGDEVAVGDPLAEIAAVVQHQAFDYLDAPVERVGARFVPLPFAPVMEEFVVPHANDVLAAVYRTVGRDA